VHDLPGARQLLIEAVDDVGASIEDEVLPCRSLLEGGSIAEAARYVRGNGVVRPERFRGERGERSRRQDDQKSGDARPNSGPSP